MHTANFIGKLGILLAAWCIRWSTVFELKSFRLYCYEFVGSL